MSLFALLIGIISATQPLRVAYQGKSYYPIQSYSTQETTWIRLRDIASVLRLEAYYDAPLEKMELHAPSHSFSLHGGNPFVNIDGSVVNLPQEIASHDGTLFVSVNQLQLLFGETLELDFALETEPRELRIFDRRIQIEALRLEGFRDSTRLLIYTSAPVQYSSTSEAPSKIRLKLSRSKIPFNLNPPRPRGLVRSLTITPSQEHVLFDVLAADRSGLFARALKNPPGVCLTVVAPLASSLSDEEMYGEIKRIIIDPGHGGKDPGAVGPSGLMEKTVNLEIARILKTLLEDRLGVEVIMTREDDRFITLDHRARIANQSSADLFLSIHCNAAPRGKKSAKGVETYFLSVARTDEARAVEARENASIRFELDDRAAFDFDDVSLILWDLAQNEFLKESQRLAEFVQSGLTGSTEIDDRGIDQAGFFVLNGVYMPSVLIECAFISNVEEEAMLKTPSFRRRLAEGILKGIEAFKRELESKSST